MSGAINDAKRICLFAHYHHLGLASGSTLYYLEQLAKAGFVTIVASSADLNETEAEKIKSRCAFLIPRENQGLDFGGWADALRSYPDMKPDLLLLANDSVYGPITDLATFIDGLTETPADFYGAVESLQFSPHVQSWFVLLRPSAYQSAGFRRLMLGQPGPDGGRLEIIEDFEVGLSTTLREEGLTSHVAFSPRGKGMLNARWPTNPMQLLWRPLIERLGIPFIKVELLRSNPSGVNTSQAIAVVRKYNPRLAALMEADARERGFQPPRPSRFYWLRVQDHLVRDLELTPGSVASRANALGFMFWWRFVRLVRAVRRSAE